MITAATLGYWALLLFAGAACGFLNTLASSGSVVTLPLLVFLGMPEGAANATNRLPVLFGTITATLTFAKHREIDWPAALKLAPSAVLGTILGTWFAELLPAREMGIAITGAVLLALILLFTKVKEALDRAIKRPPRVTVTAIALTFLVGVWIGFVVLDAATYLLVVLILVCNYDLPHANALKAVLGLVTAAVSIVMFAGAGDVYWTDGIVMAIGSMIGGYAGALLSSKARAHVWVFRLLVVTITLELLRLGWHYGNPWWASLWTEG